MLTSGGMHRSLRPASRLSAVAGSRRRIWGVAPEPVAEPLIVPMDVASPVPLFDGATATKVRRAQHLSDFAAAAAARQFFSLQLRVVAQQQQQQQLAQKNCYYFILSSFSGDDSRERPQGCFV